jgi:hypothetical protein
LFACFFCCLSFGLFVCLFVTLVLLHLISFYFL